MLQVDLVTLFPEMVSLISDYGISKRAIERQLIAIRAWDPRDFSRDKNRTVDDRPFGGGPGMVMMYEPLKAAIDAAKEKQADDVRVIYLSPQGKRLDQDGVKKLADSPGLILLAGRYEGVDQRLIDAEAHEEWSIGDYVLSGGELAALVMIDAIIRMLPGALGNSASVAGDSFFNGLLSYPQFTRPEKINGRVAPAVLLSGNHADIKRWRMKQALGRTWLLRPDLLESVALDTFQQTLLEEFQREYNRDDSGGENR